MFGFMLHAALQIEDKHDKSDKLSHSVVLADLLAYIDETKMDEDVTSIFKLSLSDLVKLYFFPVITPWSGATCTFTQY